MQKKTVGLKRAILVGQLVVNLPVLIIMVLLAILGFGLAIHMLYGISPILRMVILMLILIVSVAGAWQWWSFALPIWRQWALNNGVPEKELQKWAELSALARPKGSVVEKTETKVKK